MNARRCTTHSPKSSVYGGSVHDLNIRPSTASQPEDLGTVVKCQYQYFFYMAHTAVLKQAPSQIEIPKCSVSRCLVWSEQNRIKCSVFFRHFPFLTILQRNSPGPIFTQCLGFVPDCMYVVLHGATRWWYQPTHMTLWNS